MFRCRFAIGIGLCLLAIGPAGAANLAKVDRTIKKEPAYKGQPKYCLLVFGPEAEHRMWLALDDEALYVDRNRNGDLTEEGERVKPTLSESNDDPIHAKQRSIEVGSITIDNIKHENLTVSQTECREKVDAKAENAGALQSYLEEIARHVPDRITYGVSIGLNPKCLGLGGENKDKITVSQFAGRDRRGFLVFGKRPTDAPILHFGGELTMQVDAAAKLARGENPTETTVHVGTSGVGPGSFASMAYNLVPSDKHPVVEVQFPPKSPSLPAVTRRYVIEKRC